ncbi:MAG TPA: hypothetical protein VID27_21440, partial [Blastocatellia bacterium]
VPSSFVTLPEMTPVPAASLVRVVFANVDEQINIAVSIKEQIRERQNITILLDRYTSSVGRRTRRYHGIKLANGRPR